VTEQLGEICKGLTLVIPVNLCEVVHALT